MAQRSPRRDVILFGDVIVSTLNRVLRFFPPSYFYVTVYTGRDVLKYARRFQPAMVFLSDLLPEELDDEGPRGSPKPVVDELVRREIPVVVLAQTCDQRASAAWRERGATEVIFHPSLDFERVRRVAESIHLTAEPDFEPGEAGDE